MAGLWLPALVLGSACLTQVLNAVFFGDMPPRPKKRT